MCGSGHRIGNIIVACVYRAQGSDIETFTDKFTELIDSRIFNKSILLCGHFNISLINPQRLRTVHDFLNEMYSRFMFPVISQPTRVTSTGATLIDNIFSNDIDNTLYSGLLACDISDHLLVFTVNNAKPINSYTANHKYKYTQIRSEKEIQAFRNNLIEQDWGKVYVADVNDDYEEFLKIYINLYNANCCVR